MRDDQRPARGVPEEVSHVLPRKGLDTIAKVIDIELRTGEVVVPVPRYYTNGRNTIAEIRKQ